VHPCVCWSWMEPLEAQIRRRFFTLDVGLKLLKRNLRHGEGLRTASCLSKEQNWPLGCTSLLCLQPIDEKVRS
jgi:hypothetical protein